MKKIAMLVATAVILAGCSAQTQETQTPAVEDNATPMTQTQSESPTMAPQVQPVVVQLASVKGSGQTGTATFTDVGEGRTKVELSLTGGKFTLPQPAHIHLGTCVKPGDVKYPLTNVVDGKSETIVEAPMNSLWTGGMIVNVHKSEKESTVYTACGNLVGPNSSPAMAQPASSPAVMNNQGY